MKRPLVTTAVISYLTLVASGFYLLYSSRTGGHILSPWQTIHPAYIYVFFVATLLLGFLIVFSKLKSSNLLILIIFHSLLLHSYLPLTHDLLYGADQWRHMANETQILAGHWPAKAVLAGGAQTGFGVGDISYGLFWLVSVSLSKITGLGLIAITKWFQPILFSIAFPLLLWKLTEYLGFLQRGRFLTIWFANFPFALQAAGAFSLPVNFGFLFFLGGLIILAARARSAAWATRKIILVYAAVLAVNYLLFLILFLIGWGVVEVQSSKFKVQSLVWLVVPAAIVIPAVELLAGYSQFSTGINLFSQVKQLIGNFTGYYLASGPQPHVIATGNIIFNQVPSYVFVSNIFTVWRWWIVGFSVAFWVMVIYGFVAVWRSREYPLLCPPPNAGGGSRPTPLSPTLGERYREGYLFVGILASALTLSYVASRYFLRGEQVLTRRMDTVLAFFFIILASFGCQKFFKLLKSGREKAVLTSVGLIIFSVAITASYSFGPDTDTVSASDYQAMQYVWSQEKDSKTHCVIADTYPLLALEAISGKEIIGGGFPINAYFAQPELVRLNLILNNAGSISAVDLAEAKKLTGAASCWMIRSENSITNVKKI